jgi:hypothetical protein
MSTGGIEEFGYSTCFWMPTKHLLLTRTRLSYLLGTSLTMDTPSTHVDRAAVRFSASPALSPQFIEAPSSPVRSVHLEKMEGHQRDEDLEVADFFDDNTSDDGDSAFLADRNPEIGLKQSSLNSETLPAEHLMKPGVETIRRHPPQRPPRPSARNSSMSHLHEPIVAEEINPEENPIAAAEWGTQFTANETLASRCLAKTASRHLSLPTGTLLSALGPNKYEQVANIHAMTLEYLLRSGENEEAAALPQADEQEDIPPPKGKRRIAFIPPPINTAGKLNDQDIVRTPYPFGIRKAHLRHIALKDIPQEAILALSLRRRPNRKASRISELKIPASPDAVPVVKAKGYSPIRGNGSSSKRDQSEKHFETLDFDDAHFFRSLRAAYCRLAGPLRLFSARGLHHIEVSHSDDHSPSGKASCSSCENSGNLSCPHELPRSPMRVVSQGLSDSFSEANLMSHYHAPNKGKAQYMWVHWAHRIASTPVHLLPPAPVPTTDSPGLSSSISPTASAPVSALHTPFDEERGPMNKTECVAGLEFVEDWVPWRIGLTVMTVLGISIAAVLLWTLLGQTAIVPKWSAVNTSAERIVPAFVIGGLIWATGMTLVLLWICLSWLIE